MKELTKKYTNMLKQRTWFTEINSTHIQSRFGRFKCICISNYSYSGNALFKLSKSSLNPTTFTFLTKVPVLMSYFNLMLVYELFVYFVYGANKDKLGEELDKGRNESKPN